MDETEGDIAYDSAGTNDVFVIGDPAWEPSAGKTLDATSFFSGLIDDVRIYDRAITP